MYSFFDGIKESMQVADISVFEMFADVDQERIDIFESYFYENIFPDLENQRNFIVQGLLNQGQIWHEQWMAERNYLMSQEDPLKTLDGYRQENRKTIESQNLLRSQYATEALEMSASQQENNRDFLYDYLDYSN